MATINDKLSKKVEKMYYLNGLSAQDIANRLDVSLDAVFYCMRKKGLKRRTASESNSIKYEKSKPSFKLKKLNSESLRILKAIGAMLYWGEGYKNGNKAIIDFANSDKDMIVVFLKFLRKICGIDENRLRVYCYFYANQNTKKNINYWSKITGVSKKQFTKPYVRNDYRKNKVNKMPYGLIHIRYSDKKLLNLIKNWIEGYKSI